MIFVLSAEFVVQLGVGAGVRLGGLGPGRRREGNNSCLSREWSVL